MKSSNVYPEASPRLQQKLNNIEARKQERNTARRRLNVVKAGFGILAVGGVANYVDYNLDKNEVASALSQPYGQVIESVREGKINAHDLDVYRVTENQSAAVIGDSIGRPGDGTILADQISAQDRETTLPAGAVFAVEASKVTGTNTRNAELVVTRPETAGNMPAPAK